MTVPSPSRAVARSRGAIDPRLLRRGRATLGYLVAGVAVGCAVAGLTIVQAWALANALGDIFATHTLGTLAWAVPVLAAVFAGKAVLAWLNSWLAHRAAAAVKSRLRRDILAARLAHPIDPGGSTAGLVTLVTQGLDALDGYYAKYLPQLVLAVTVPLIIGVAVLRADVISAVIVAVTLPLIPVFMALVGWTTQARTRRRWHTQVRLAHHFADLVAGLPTLQVFGRAKAQAEGLRRSEAAHHRETMGTLRISFLSALVLEVLATLSVAVVAVTIGFRVVYDQVDLTTAFFVLILAPEIYLPVRQVGVHYHDAADGMAAAEAAFALIDAAPAVDGEHVPATGRVVADATTATATAHAPPLLSVHGLGHTYPGAASPALAGLSFALPRGELLALTGPSGAGKTTALHALLGFLTASAGRIEVDGAPLTDLAAWRARVAWVGQSPGMVSGTVADNVRLGAPAATDTEVRAALDRSGAAGIALDHRVGDEAEGLSAGERRRVAMARALVRVERGGADVLLLDEPTAGLDAVTEAALLRSVASSGASCVVVSHRPAVIALADQVVAVEAVPATAPSTR